MPYTLGLLGSLPRLDSQSRHRLTPIVGSPPSLVNMPPGCPFAPRCPLHIPECDAAEPPLFEVGLDHSAACIRTDVVALARGQAAEVFDESSSDALLADDVLIGGAAPVPEGGEVPAGSLPSPTGPTEGPAGGTDTVTTPRGER